MPTNLSLLAVLSDPKLFAVSYDLNAVGQDYTGLIGRLREMRAVRVQLSHWWVSSHLTAEMLRNELLRFTDVNDSLLVAELAGDVSGWENHEHLRNWMNAVLAARRRVA